MLTSLTASSHPYSHLEAKVEAKVEEKVAVVVALPASLELLIGNEASGAAASEVALASSCLQVRIWV